MKQCRNGRPEGGVRLQPAERRARGGAISIRDICAQSPERALGIAGPHFSLLWVFEHLVTAEPLSLAGPSSRGSPPATQPSWRGPSSWRSRSDTVTHG